ncbi:hypothetical protein ABPG74_002490 [Tetrahymena malaccensis]
MKKISVSEHLKEYFFSYSEQFDQEYVQMTSTYQDLDKQCSSDRERLFFLLDALELNLAILKKDIMLTLFSLCAKFQNGKMILNTNFIEELYHNDGINIVDSTFKDSVEKLVQFQAKKNKKQDNSPNDTNEMIDTEIQLKASLNTLFLLIIHMQETNKDELIKYFEDKKFEEYLMKMIQLSVELFLIPIKKIISLFYLYLTIYLQDTNDSGTKLDDNYYTEDNMNQIEKGPPRLFIQKPTKIEQFYQRNVINQADIALAQIIVVGLLRTMLTTCATNNKYNPNNKGIDLNREWESSLIHILQYKDEINLQKDELKKYIDDYNQYIENNKDFPQKDEKENDLIKKDSSDDLKEKSRIKIELDRHRLFTANIISSFILLLAKKFKHNCVWQFSYLIQLITDANGVLVFLKFLTDKFQNINYEIPYILSDKVVLMDVAGDTVYKISKLMYITCNNFTEKISQYLIDYQAFFILKKLPQQFTMREVSKYCYKLMKLQIPMFDKRMLKSNQSYVKVISDLFCKVYPNFEPDKFTKSFKEEQKKFMNEADKAIKEEPLKQLYLLEGIRDRKSMLANYCNQDEVRKINAEFNNYHYWKADESKKELKQKLNIDESGIYQDQLKLKKQILNKMWDEVQIPEDFENNYENWLEDNVWSYYD